MSFIDCFGHEYVASFAGLPVYHPLQAISGDFSAGPDTLLLGGGSGEHPALVIRHLDQVASFYVDYALERVYDPFDPDEGIYERSKILRDRVTPYDCLDFVCWNVEDFVDFHARCTSRLMQEPFERGGEFGQLEGWLVHHFGKLLCLSMPDLVPALEGDMKEAWDIAKTCHEVGSNFVCVPPGFPIPGGRRSEGSMSESLSAWTPGRRNKA